MSATTTLDFRSRSRNRNFQLRRHSVGARLVAILYCADAVVTSFEPLKIAASHPLSRTTLVSGIAVHPVYLRNNDPASPYALAVSNGNDLPVATMETGRVNFLATQVWPSARTAALALERYFQNCGGDTAETLSVCEFGCGPGLPSLAAAKLGAGRVYATDLDGLALALVKQAAAQQGLSARLETKQFDLIHSCTDKIPCADLYIFSDVFENGHVAEGAAKITAELLSRRRTTAASSSSSVWVFAQSDRAQREIYLLSWRHSESSFLRDSSSFAVPADSQLQCNGRLWLCDIDETNVFYG
jgi:SAM-dependent methyltransferase